MEVINLAKKEDMDLAKIQEVLGQFDMPGWLFYDFKGLDNLSYKILKIPNTINFTRRWFYFIPREGDPVKLVNAVESNVLDFLPGEKFIYSGWKDMETKLSKMLSGIKTVAMQYSHLNAIPFVSRVDAGTIEIMKKFKKKVVTSADLVQELESVWTVNQYQGHLNAAKRLKSIVENAFLMIADKIKNDGQCTEYEIQKFMYWELIESKLETEAHPIVAVNQNSSNPHYVPTETNNAVIKMGDFVLLDIWAKSIKQDGVYADITWVGYVGGEVPDNIKNIFDIVRDARDLGFNFIKDRLAGGKEVYGYEVDDVVRNYIAEKGYADKFIHRTGHNIGDECHGSGVNLDNLETCDERKIIPGICFSIEPGIYLDEFGIRSEINVYIDGKDAVITTTPYQTEVVAILK